MALNTRRKRGGKQVRKTQKASHKRSIRAQRGGAEEPKAVLFVLGNSVGFFSMYFTLCKAYLYAKEKGAKFYIDHDAWNYTYE